MTVCLGIESAGGGLGVAVTRTGDGDGPAATLSLVERAPGHGHAEHILPMIQAALAEAGVMIGAVGLIAVGVGPGSFTGVRVGLAAARGLGFALDRPIIGVTSFEAVVEAVLRGRDPADRRPVLVLIDSKRADVFAQCFGADGAPLGSPAALAPAALAGMAPAGSFVVAGDAAASFGGSGAIVSTVRASAVDIARIGLRRFASGWDFPALPVYLRAPDTTPPGPRSAAAAVFRTTP